MARCRLRVLVLVPLLLGLLLPFSCVWTTSSPTFVPSRLHHNVGLPVTAPARQRHAASTAVPSRQLGALGSALQLRDADVRSWTAHALPQRQDLFVPKAVEASAAAAPIAQRRSALWGGLLLAVGGMNGQAPARADVPRNVVVTLKIYALGLQEAADQLVFGIKPRIVKEDWPWLRNYLRSDSYGNSKGYIDLAFALDRVVVGNEDFFEGVENANIKMVNLLKEANQTVWEESPGRQEALLKTWEQMAAVVGEVMTSINSFVAAEPELQGVSTYVPFVLPTKDASQYGRSIEAYAEKCTGVMTSGVCLDLPKGSDKMIADNAQFALSVNPLTRSSCNEGKCE